jgi:predicted Zn-dependent peptidase
MTYPEIKFHTPEPERFTLSNGIEIMYFEDRELPLVKMGMLFKTSELCVPSDKTGLSDITGQMMRLGGAGDYSPEQVEEKLYKLGADININIGYDFSSLGVSSLNRDFDPTLAQLADMLLRPKFDQKVFAQTRDSMLSDIAHRGEDQHFIADYFLRKTLFGDHPYARFTSADSLKNIKIEDLKEFHRKYVIPNGALIYVSGNIQKEELKSKLETYLGKWQKSDVAIPSAPPIKQLAQKQIVLVEKDVEQSVISLGRLGIARLDLDEMSCSVMNEILGGAFSSRLQMAVRQKEGLAYGIGSYFSPTVHQGIFSVGTDTKSASTAKAIEIIIRELDKIQQSGVTAEELAEAKRSMLNSFVFNFENKFALVSTFANLDFCGYPKNHLRDRQERVGKVSLEQIQTVAAKYTTPETFVISVVGNKQALDSVKKQFQGKWDIVEKKFDN